VTGDPEWQEYLETEAHVRFVAFGELRLRVVEAGAPEGEPLLLIHGFADSAYTWHRNLRALAGAGFRAIAYDCPGCGESALPDGFRFGVDDLARVALGLLDVLGLERVRLVGHSMGGGVALQLALHQADRLHWVLLLAPTCYHAFARPFIYLFRWPPFHVLARLVTGPWMALPVLVWEYADMTLLTPQVVAQYRLAFRRPEYVRACHGLLRDYWNEAFAETARRYGEISVPLHVIWGERDTSVSRRDIRRLAADTGADLTVVPRAGHLLNQTQPGVFNEAVVRLLREVR
jgi:pimeloyl-ACP methyl ester carboxylesterase